MWIQILQSMPDQQGIEPESKCLKFTLGNSDPMYLDKFWSNVPWQNLIKCTLANSDQMFLEKFWLNVHWQILIKCTLTNSDQMYIGKFWSENLVRQKKLQFSKISTTWHFSLQREPQWDILRILRNVSNRKCQGNCSCSKCENT